jgi:magnesium-transporting ATPase (P-type)
MEDEIIVTTSFSNPSDSNDIVGPTTIRIDRLQSASVLVFQTRTQELTSVIRQLTSGHILAEEDQLEAQWEHELKGFHVMSITEITSYLHSIEQQGLSSADAAERYQTNGPNTIEEVKQIPMWVKFLLSFFQGLNPLLWFSLIFIFLSWKPFGERGRSEYSFAFYKNYLYRRSTLRCI